MKPAASPMLPSSWERKENSQMPYTLLSLSIKKRATPPVTYETFLDVFDDLSNDGIWLAIVDLDKHSARVFGAKFSPNNQRIVTHSEDGTAKLWPSPSVYAAWIENLGLIPLSETKKKEYGIE